MIGHDDKAGAAPLPGQRECLRDGGEVEGGELGQIVAVSSLHGTKRPRGWHSKGKGFQGG